MALSPEDISDIKIGRALEAMVATEGWKHYVRILGAHLEQRKTQALQPFVVKQENKATHQILFGALDQLLSSEADKGAIMALTLAIGLPAGIISNMTELLAKSPDKDED